MSFNSNSSFGRKSIGPQSFNGRSSYYNNAASQSTGPITGETFIRNLPTTPGRPRPVLKTPAKPMNVFGTLNNRGTKRPAPDDEERPLSFFEAAIQRKYQKDMEGSFPPTPRAANGMSPSSQLLNEQKTPSNNAATPASIQKMKKPEQSHTERILAPYAPEGSKPISASETSIFATPQPQKKKRGWGLSNLFSSRFGRSANTTPIKPLVPVHKQSPHGTVSSILGESQPTSQGPSSGGSQRQSPRTASPPASGLTPRIARFGSSFFRSPTFSFSPNLAKQPEPSRRKSGEEIDKIQAGLKSSVAKAKAALAANRESKARDEYEKQKDRIRAKKEQEERERRDKIFADIVREQEEREQQEADEEAARDLRDFAQGRRVSYHAPREHESTRDEAPRPATAHAASPPAVRRRPRPSESQKSSLFGFPGYHASQDTEPVMGDSSQIEPPEPSDQTVDDASDHELPEPGLDSLIEADDKSGILRYNQQQKAEQTTTEAYLPESESDREREESYQESEEEEMTPELGTTQKRDAEPIVLSDSNSEDERADQEESDEPQSDEDAERFDDATDQDVKVLASDEEFSQYSDDEAVEASSEDEADYSESAGESYDEERQVDTVGGNADEPITLGSSDEEEEEEEEEGEEKEADVKEAATSEKADESEAEEEAFFNQIFKRIEPTKPEPEAQPAANQFKKLAKEALAEEEPASEVEAETEKDEVSEVVEEVKTTEPEKEASPEQAEATMAQGQKEPETEPAALEPATPAAESESEADADVTYPELPSTEPADKVETPSDKPYPTLPSTEPTASNDVEVPQTVQKPPTKPFPAFPDDAVWDTPQKSPTKTKEMQTPFDKNEDTIAFLDRHLGVQEVTGETPVKTPEHVLAAVDEEEEEDDEYQEDSDEEGGSSEEGSEFGSDEGEEEGETSDEDEEEEESEAEKSEQTTSSIFGGAFGAVKRAAEKVKGLVNPSQSPEDDDQEKPAVHESEEEPERVLLAGEQPEVDAIEAGEEPEETAPPTVEEEQQTEQIPADAEEPTLPERESSETPKKAPGHNVTVEDVGDETFHSLFNGSDATTIPDDELDTNMDMLGDESRLTDYQDAEQHPAAHEDVAQAHMEDEVDSGAQAGESQSSDSEDGDTTPKASKLTSILQPEQDIASSPAAPHSPIPPRPEGRRARYSEFDIMREEVMEVDSEGVAVETTTIIEGTIEMVDFEGDDAELEQPDEVEEQDVVMMEETREEYESITAADERDTEVDEIPTEEEEIPTEVDEDLYAADESENEEDFETVKQQPPASAQGEQDVDMENTEQYTTAPQETAQEAATEAQDDDLVSTEPVSASESTKEWIAADARAHQQFSPQREVNMQSEGEEDTEEVPEEGVEPKVEQETAEEEAKEAKAEESKVEEEKSEEEHTEEEAEEMEHEIEEAAATQLMSEASSTPKKRKRLDTIQANPTLPAISFQEATPVTEPSTSTNAPAETPAPKKARREAELERLKQEAIEHGAELETDDAPVGRSLRTRRGASREVSAEPAPALGPKGRKSRAATRERSVTPALATATATMSTHSKPAAAAEQSAPVVLNKPSTRGTAKAASVRGVSPAGSITVESTIAPEGATRPTRRSTRARTKTPEPAHWTEELIPTEPDTEPDIPTAEPRTRRRGGAAQPAAQSAAQSPTSHPEPAVSRTTRRTAPSREPSTQPEPTTTRSTRSTRAASQDPVSSQSSRITRRTASREPSLPPPPPAAASISTSTRRSTRHASTEPSTTVEPPTRSLRARSISLEPDAPSRKRTRKTAGVESSTVETVEEVEEEGSPVKRQHTRPTTTATATRSLRGASKETVKEVSESVKENEAPDSVASPKKRAARKTAAKKEEEVREETAGRSLRSAGARGRSVSVDPAAEEMGAVAKKGRKRKVESVVESVEEVGEVEEEGKERAGRRRKTRRG